MQVFFTIAYFVMGFVQFFAVIDGIRYALGLGRFVSGVLAFFVTYVPLVGTAVGVYGAVNVWDWSLVQAIALFFWYIPVLILVGAISAFARP